jgi:hypothetical protein
MIRGAIYISIATALKPFRLFWRSCNGHPKNCRLFDGHFLCCLIRIWLFKWRPGAQPETTRFRISKAVSLVSVKTGRPSGRPRWLQGERGTSGLCVL